MCIFLAHVRLDSKLCPIQNNKEITREQVHSETLGRRNVSRQSGLREHADRGERVGKGTPPPQRFPLSVQYTAQRRYLKASSRDGAQCGLRPNLALQGAVKGKTPKVGRQGRVGGSRRVCRRLTLVFLVFTFTWGYHLLSPANSLAGRQPSQPATDGPWGPFWGWCPL